MIFGRPRLGKKTGRSSGRNRPVTAEILTKLALLCGAIALSGCVSQVSSAWVASSCSPVGDAAPTIRVVTWNIGYGGEGASADFFSDGGRHLIPSNRATVIANTKGIAATLYGMPADIYLIQEAARPSTVNHNIDVLEGITASLPCYDLSYSSKVSQRLLGIHLNIGQAMLSRWKPRTTERLDLSGFSNAQLLVQRFFLLVQRYRVPGRDGELVVANAHLAVFDKDAAIRMTELAEVARFAQKEYADGNYVIIGGDWNLEFTTTDFPYTTSAKNLTWVYRFPRWFPPPGWTRVFDPAVPTVRSLDKPFVRGENFTTIGDGFVISRNISAVEVRTLDNAFAFSDHQPVSATFRLNP